MEKERQDALEVEKEENPAPEEKAEEKSRRAVRLKGKKALRERNQHLNSASPFLFRDRMRGVFLALFLLVSFSLPAFASDKVYMDCPVLFTKATSNITVSYFQQVIPPIDGSCVQGSNGLQLSMKLDGVVLSPLPINTNYCLNGLRTYNITTSSGKFYEINASSTYASAACNVTRIGTTGTPVKIPDTSVFLIPMVAVLALFVLRRKH